MKKWWLLVLIVYSTLLAFWSGFLAEMLIASTLMIDIVNVALFAFFLVLLLVYIFSLKKYWLKKWNWFLWVVFGVCVLVLWYGIYLLSVGDIRSTNRYLTIFWLLPLVMLSFLISYGLFFWRSKKYANKWEISIEQKDVPKKNIIKKIIKLVFAILFLLTWFFLTFMTLSSLFKSQVEDLLGVEVEDFYDPMAEIDRINDAAWEHNKWLWCGKDTPERRKYIAEKCATWANETSGRNRIFGSCEIDAWYTYDFGVLGCADMVMKPVIYLYPEEKQEVLVQLDYQGELIADYPAYDATIWWWDVVANPDGTLINKADGKEYSYLFWEWNPQRANYDLSRWFVVKGEDTIAFLQEKLSEMWLTPREYNEFIVYRYPQMKDNAYNFITFAGEEYTQTAPLKITPTPDSMLRVFMVYKPLDEYVEVQPQIIEPFQRSWFSVIERWGTKIE